MQHIIWKNYHGISLSHILLDNILRGVLDIELESYNHFVNNEIQKTIDMFNPATIHSEHDYDKN